MNRERAIRTNHPSYFKERGEKKSLSGLRLIYALAPIRQIKKKETWLPPPASRKNQALNPKKTPLLLFLECNPFARGAIH